MGTMFVDKAHPFYLPPPPFQMEIKDHELAMSKSSAKAKNRDDARLTLAQQKLSSVTAEVDSLKAVLELKSDEVKRLRVENARLEEKLEEFDAMALELRKTNALVEDLKEQIQTKTCQGRTDGNKRLSSFIPVWTICNLRCIREFSKYKKCASLITAFRSRLRTALRFFYIF